MTTIPDIVARGQQFGLERQDEMLQSFSGREVAVQQRSAYWSFTIPVVPRSNAEAKKWRAVMVELANMSNSFEATPPGYRGTAYSQERVQDATPLTLSNGEQLALNDGTLLTLNAGFVGGGAIFVDGAGQLGRELAYNGADASVVVFQPGEYFSVNGELKIVTAQSSSDGGGAGVVEFEPAFRNPPPSGDPIEIAEPVASFRLVGPIGGWQLSPNRLHSFTLNAVETY